MRRPSNAARAANAPDLLILDLNLDGSEGFTVLRHPALQRCATVIVSAHTDRALDAFAYGVRDFVPKPFSRERLEVALRRALDGRAEVAPRLAIRRGGQTILLPCDDIVCVRGAGARSEVVLTANRTIECDRMLDHIEQTLPQRFQRIHKSVIVDTARIRKLVAEEGSRYSVELNDGTTLPVGRTRVGALRARLRVTA